MSSAEHNSWIDFLATPPNMMGTPPSQLPGDLFSNFEPAPSPILFEPPLQNFLNSSAPQNASPPSTKQTYTPQQQYPEYGELENRTLAVSNANPETTEEEIMAVFNTHRGVKQVDMSKISEGYFTVEYYDIRSATSSKLLYNGSTLKGKTINVSYAPLPIILDPKKPPNNGTIVIFHLPAGITDDQIITIFGQFGEIRQIRGTPTKTQQRFVEYFDTRHAEAALLSMSGKYVMGARVSIEFSLPGGFRRGIQKVEKN